MNGLQYKHYPDQKRTYAIHPPLLSKLEEAMAAHIADAPHELVFALGKARVHPSDHYSKADGRKVSFDKIKMVKMRLDSFASRNNGTIELLLKGSGYSILLTVRKNREVAIVREVFSRH
jgi:hypothetical protein